MQKIKNYLFNLVEKRIKNIWKRYLIKLVIFIYTYMNIDIANNVILWISDMKYSAAFFVLSSASFIASIIFIKIVNNVTDKGYENYKEKEKIYKQMCDDDNLEKPSHVIKTYEDYNEAGNDLLIYILSEILSLLLSCATGLWVNETYENYTDSVKTHKEYKELINRPYKINIGREDGNQ